MWKSTPEAEFPGTLFFVASFSIFIVASFAYMILLQPTSFFYNAYGVAWFAHGTGFIFGMLAAALAVFTLLCIESWNRCRCLFCCIPKEGAVCNALGQELDTPICRTS